MSGGMHNAAYVAVVRNAKTGKLCLYGCHSKSRQMAEWETRTACQQDFDSGQIEIVDGASALSHDDRAVKRGAGMKNYGLHIQKQAKELSDWFHHYLAWSIYQNTTARQRAAVIRRIAKMRQLLDEMEKDMQS